MKPISDTKFFKKTNSESAKAFTNQSPTGKDIVVSPHRISDVKSEDLITRKTASFKKGKVIKDPVIL